MLHLLSKRAIPLLTEYFWSGLLPPLQDMPRLRALFLVIEATLYQAFWAIMSKPGGELYPFGIPALCSWVVDSFPYTGLCSHTSLSEHPGKPWDLSPEDLAALLEQRRLRFNDRKRLANALQFANNRSQQRFHCEPCKYDAAHQVNFDVHLASKRHLRKIKSNAVSPLKIHRNADARARNIKNKRYRCAPCN
jgi:hypothetical protein